MRYETNVNVRIERRRFGWRGAVTALAAGSLLLTGVSTASATDDDGGVSATAAALEQAGMFQAAETVSPSSTGGDAAASTARVTADNGLAVEGSTGIESTIGVSWADLGSSTRVASADVFASADSSHNVAFTGWGASAAAAAACALGGPAFAAACLALGAVVTVVATQAYNQGDCLGIRNTGPSPVYPAIYSASESPNCR